jgi:hypothetical protein
MTAMHPDGPASPRKLSKTAAAKLRLKLGGLPDVRGALPQKTQMEAQKSLPALT